MKKFDAVFRFGKGGRALALVAAGLALCLFAGCAAREGPAQSASPSSSPRESSSTASPASAGAGGGEGWELAIDTTDLSGNAVTQADFAGNTLTVLNVWATWCPPCVSELPELQKVSAAFADQGVQVVGVLQDGVDETGAAVDNIVADAKALLEHAGADYTVILPDEGLQAQFINKMQYFPTTFFLDGSGQVVDTIIGANDFESWSEHIEKALAQL